MSDGDSPKSRGEASHSPVTPARLTMEQVRIPLNLDDQVNMTFVAKLGQIAGSCSGYIVHRAVRTSLWNRLLRALANKASGSRESVGSSSSVSNSHWGTD